MNRSKLPPMPLMVEEIMDDGFCRGLSDADFGRYMRMLCRQWLEGAVPADAGKTVMDAGLDHASEGPTAKLLEEKFMVRDGLAVNPRLDEVRRKRLDLAEKRRANGRLGGRPKNKKKAARKPSGASPEPTAGFARFWAEYPRKVSKGQASKTWTKLKLEAKADEVIGGLRRCVQSKDWRGRESKYLPHASSWLNNEGWLDQPDSGITQQGRNDPFSNLAPAIQASLFSEVQSSDRQTLHQRGNIDTERAMRRLAKQKGLI